MRAARVGHVIFDLCVTKTRLSNELKILPFGHTLHNAKILRPILTLGSAPLDETQWGSARLVASRAWLTWNANRCVLPFLGWSGLHAEPPGFPFTSILSVCGDTKTSLSAVVKHEVMSNNVELRARYNKSYELNTTNLLSECLTQYPTHVRLFTDI